MLFQKYAEYLIEIAFNEDATAYELLTIALAFAALWGVVFEVGKLILGSLTHDKPWLRSACEREYDRSGKEMNEAMGIKITKEEAIAEMMNGWALWQMISLQHLAGALLCVPSVLGLGDPKWASSLAVCGILSEMGFEIQSSVEVGYKRLFTADGAKKVPNVYIICMLVHHSLTSTMAVPMILRYRELKALHWLACDLQFAGAGICMTEYSKLLDITNKPNHLRQFKVINFLQLVLIGWTRGLHWFYLCFQLVTNFYQDKAWGFMGVGGLALAIFSCFNVFLCIIPMWKRFMKFLNKSVEYGSLPADASDAQRRRSTVALQDAASELLLDESIVAEERIAMFLESLFDGRPKLERTRTMPARSRSAWGSTRMMRAASTPAGGWKEN